MNATPSLKAKIAALRAKTRQAGCTEAEALAAAELAARLMREHGLSDADLVMTEAAGRESTVRPTWRSTLAAIIAHCTNTASIALVLRGQGTVVLFVGRAPGPEVALYLRDVCFRAVDAEVRRFKAGRFYRRRRSLTTRRAAVADFVEGLVTRLSSRLLELFAPTRDSAAREAAQQALDRRFEGAVAHRHQAREPRFSEAASAGYVAGGTVPLNRGIGAKRAPLAIERGR